MHGRRRRRSRLSGFLRVVAIILLLVLLYVFGALLYANSQITREPVGNLSSSGELYHVLVTGSDSRENLTQEERSQLSTGSAGGNRTDTIFVMTIRGGQAAMLAFPRDLFVTLCDGSQGRINGAAAVNGQGCLAETVSRVSGLPIRHTLQIEFLGFRDLVDAVGGVELCLDEPIADRDAGIDLPAGCQVLNGPDALGYVRVRKIDNDLERIKRQQQFLQSLASELATPATVLNPFRFYGVAGAGGRALTADAGFSTLDLVRVGRGARGLAGGAVVAETVPATPATVGGASVLQMDENAAGSVFAQFRDGSIFDRIPDPDADVPPEDISLVVLNGSNVDGLAGDTAEVLRERGFNVTDIGNADPIDQTTVRYPPGSEAAARTVANEVPGGAELVEDDTAGQITLILAPPQ